MEGFQPGTEFKYQNFTIKTIHLPGHSPGHLVFNIGPTDSSRKVLFASDIGLDHFGAFYGFKYNDIAQIRKDVRILENLYLKDLILVSRALFQVLMG